MAASDPKYRGKTFLLKRRISQVTALLILHSSWGPEAKWLCNPVLSCHSCVLAWFACPIGVFIHYSGYHAFPFFAVGTVLLVGVLVGRLFCGWICPFGFLSDMLHKIPSPKFTMPAWTSYIKYAVLGLGVIALPFIFGESTNWSFCRVCPASAVQVTIPGLLGGGYGEIETATIVKLAVLAAVVMLAVMSSRSFCKAFCPIGAMLAPLNYISFWVVKRPKPACTGCTKCDRACPQSTHPSEKIQAGTPPNRNADCIVCHDCRAACPVVKKQKQSAKAAQKTDPPFPEDRLQQA